MQSVTCQLSRASLGDGDADPALLLERTLMAFVSRSSRAAGVRLGDDWPGAVFGRDLMVMLPAGALPMAAHGVAHLPEGGHELPKEN